MLVLPSQYLLLTSRSIISYLNGYFLKLGLPELRNLHSVLNSFAHPGPSGSLVPKYWEKNF